MARLPLTLISKVPAGKALPNRPAIQAPRK